MQKEALVTLPDFTSDGVLPADDYPMTIDELRKSMLVHGRQGVTDEAWDSQWRADLVNNASILVKQLWDIGINEIFFDGSFVENKARPGDIDGYFECPWNKKISGDLERELNLLDPHTVWTWNLNERQNYAGKARLPMWIRYRTELYPHLIGGPCSFSSGITDEHGNDLEFPSVFRQSREFVQKGIVKIIQ
jgi:hypothetical protein